MEPATFSCLCTTLQPHPKSIREMNRREYKINIPGMDGNSIIPVVQRKKNGADFLFDIHIYHADGENLGSQIWESAWLNSAEWDEKSLSITVVNGQAFIYIERNPEACAYQVKVV